MTIKTLFAASLFALQATATHAIPVSVGETIRGAYSIPLSGSNEVEPLSFLLRLFNNDPFGGSDSVGIRYLDDTLTPQSFTTVDANGAGLDQTIGIPFGPSDLLPGIVGPGDPPRIPQSGFIEIVGLGGSFDVRNITLAVNEQLEFSAIFRQVLVSDFSYTSTPPAPVPLPAAAVLLISSVLGLFGFRFTRSNSWEGAS